MNEQIFSFVIRFYIVRCEVVYGRMVDVVTPAHWLRSEGYYVELHFLKALNRKILWRKS